MCTCGAFVSHNKTLRATSLAAKTIDFYASSLWVGRVHSTEGYQAIGCGLVPQIGVNSGMNEKGLVVLLSYLDYRGPFDHDDTIKEIPSSGISVWAEDYRAIINAEILSRCSSANEAIELLYQLVPHYKGMPGGNHMLLDSEGRLAVFEHCNGVMNHMFYESYVARGNNGRCVRLAEQSDIPEMVNRDRTERYQSMETSVYHIWEALQQGGTKVNAEQQLKRQLAEHKNDGGIGSICCHSLSLTGARANTNRVLSTVSAIIFDPLELVMHFTEGSPCKVLWQSLPLAMV